MKIKHLAVAITLALGVSNMAFADTSSAIRGNVVTAAGESAANATVEILHVPSGTRSVATTNEAGVFSSSGLRVGGPYVITIRSAQGTKTYENVFLALGEQFRLNAQLESDVERIAVTGTSMVYANNAGSSSFFGTKDIENAPSFNRDLKDIIRNNPLVNINGADGTISVAGTNPRFNSIAVDGIGLNDDFGLNMTGYPTTRSPISLDAIDQVIVDTSPFNAKDSGFQGAKINAVTKSGTNELSGSFFFEKQNDSLAGKFRNPNTRVEDSLDFDEKTWGATLGGALIKDKLFFFGSYEKYKSPQASGWGPSGAAGVANETNATEAEMNQVAEIAKRIYGIDDIGGWAASPETKEEKLLLKLDWNINDFHRAALTYQKSEGNQINNTTDDARTLKLSSQWYDRSENMESYALKFFSDWTNEFSTEIYATYQDRDTGQDSLSTLPQVSVELGSNNTISFGSDESRHANELANKTKIFGADATYLLDEHKITFGYQYKETEAMNLYVRASRGSYTFDGLTNFENKIADEIRYQNAPSLNPRDAAVAFKRGEHALYAQDEYAVTPDLLLNFGVRYERMTTSDTPGYNAAFETATGYNNTENLDGLDIVLPRFSFRWDAADELVVRGGIGRFSGGQPSVWAGNAYGSTGLNMVDTGYVNSGNSNADLVAALTNVDITTVPDAFKNYVSQGANSEINFNDPNFKMPSDWRYQIAADYRFDLGDLVQNILWTTEYTYVQPENSAFWVNVNAGDVFHTAADGRKLYDKDDDSKPALMLTNADKEGRSHIITTLLSKRWESGVSLNTSYTYQDITSASVGSASSANGNYGNNIAINRNEALIGTSPYETKHRFVINLSYETEFFDGYSTTFSSFFERKSGKTLSYLANIHSRARTAFGYEASGGGMLAYIPTRDDAQYTFANTAAQDRFYDTIESMGLSDYIGSYVPKGEFNSPWVTTWDISVRQQIPGFLEGHKGELYFTVDNFLNLLDKSKGQVNDTQYGTMNLYQITAVDATTGQMTINPYSPRGGNNWERFNDMESTWRLKLGVKYRF